MAQTKRVYDRSTIDQFSIDEALRRCSECKHEVINCYRQDDQGNVTKLPQNYKQLMSESGICLEPVVTGSSCDVVMQDYRKRLGGKSFNGCPFFEKK